MKIKFSPPSLPQQGILAGFITEDLHLTPALMTLNEKQNGHLLEAVKSAKFEAKRDQMLDILAPGDGYDRIILFGLGNPENIKALELEMLGGFVGGALKSLKITHANLLTDLAAMTKISAQEIAALLASGLKLRVYNFEKYKTKSKNKNSSLEEVTLLSPDHIGAQALYETYEAISTGVHMARDLVNEPANKLTPITFANHIKSMEKDGLKVEILDVHQMEKLGMGALLGTAQGSANEARLVVMRWEGDETNEAPLAFIGKGVTFDSGGISIKPAAGMEDMKGDMAGAACVTGLMLTLAKRKAKINAIGAVGLAENMPDGAAQRPGDIVNSASGQTIAVLNTDAEGRLILADLLWYVQDRFKPKFMINLATLTGAIMVALGKEYAGLFSNNDELANRLSEVGLATGEKVWRLPLSPEYDKMLDSDVADMKNIGDGRNAGAIVAAQFLQRFVNNVPWAHLDIAGTSMSAPKNELNQSWGSGWGVRLLNRLINQYYER